MHIEIMISVLVAELLLKVVPEVGQMENWLHFYFLKLSTRMDRLRFAHKRVGHISYPKSLGVDPIDYILFS